MKYMGSKRGMLGNGLGHLIEEHGSRCDRFLDLFSGSGAVSWFAAQQLQKPVHAFDLQAYAATLAKAVVARTTRLSFAALVKRWWEPAVERTKTEATGIAATNLDTSHPPIQEWSATARRLCRTQDGGVIWKAYGGHYFSPRQAAMIDALITELPAEEPERSACLAAVILAASRTVAAPGHTAQPFQATSTAGQYLEEAWQLDVGHYAKEALRGLVGRHARVRGKATVKDAAQAAIQAQHGDLVFVDPPYSAVQYSRFYHVLETIATGRCGQVTGVGRYPVPSKRPSSLFSQVTHAADALELVLEELAHAGCTVLLTFPAQKCSNGLSGTAVIEMASDLFRISRQEVVSNFSTLGGNGHGRDARQKHPELILLLKARYSATAHSLSL